MAGDRILAALDELQAERNTLLDLIQFHQRELETAVKQVDRLNDAITSLISLRPELVEGHDRSKRTSIPAQEWVDAVVVDDADSDPDIVPKLSYLVPGAERIQMFITPGGDGKNLQSTQMVASVVNAIGEPVSRERLQRMFFDFFGKDALAAYWQNPEKSFRTALRRALERELIVEVSSDNGPLYMGGFRDRHPGESPVNFWGLSHG